VEVGLYQVLSWKLLARSHSNLILRSTLRSKRVLRTFECYKKGKIFFKKLMLRAQKAHHRSSAYNNNFHFTLLFIIEEVPVKVSTLEFEVPFNINVELTASCVFSGFHYPLDPCYSLLKCNQASARRSRLFNSHVDLSQEVVFLVFLQQVLLEGDALGQVEVYV
jgi:hypothetical protein